MKKIAFATIESYDGLGEELEAVFAALSRMNIHADTLPLDDLCESKAVYDAVLLQTISGYHYHLDKTLGQLEGLEKAGYTLLNNAEVVRWNSDKHYLQELESKGVCTLPTVWLEQGDTADLQALLQESGWNDAVVKPAVSAGAFETKRINLANASENQTWLEKVTSERAMMLQPFAPEIVAEGEWSFLYFNGHFSHAVLKTPQSGDYRVQHVHGGGYHHLSTPPQNLLRDANDMMHHLPADMLYARVDGIQRDGKLMLMEVELIEPFLYLLPDKQAVETFSLALSDRLLNRQVAA